MDGTACRVCRKVKFDFEYRIIGTKNPRFSMACIMCLIKEKKGIDRRARGEYIKEWYWNGFLMHRNKNQYPSRVNF